MVSGRDAMGAGDLRMAACINLLEYTRTVLATDDDHYHAARLTPAERQSAIS